MKLPNVWTKFVSSLALVGFVATACNPTEIQSPPDLSSTSKTGSILSTETIVEKLTPLPTFTSEPSSTPEPTITPTLEPTSILSGISPTVPDWAKAAVEQELSQMIQLDDGQVVVIRGLREGEDPNISLETRIMLILNEETNEWFIPLPTIEETYAKYVNPFKTRTFATQEMTEYEPEIFDIPSLEPAYLQHWLSQFSQLIMENTELMAGYIDLRNSYCLPPDQTMYGGASECEVLFNYMLPMYLKHQDYLIIAAKTGMPKVIGYSTEYFTGVTYLAIDIQTLSKKQQELYPESIGLLQGIEDHLLFISGKIGMFVINIGTKADDPDYSGEMLFRNILDSTHPGLAAKLHTFLDTNGEEFSDGDREELMGWMSDTILPGYPFASFERTSPDITDWRENIQP